MQNDETIDNFWNLITLPALNDDIKDVSVDMGVMLFQTALMGPPHNAAIGYPLVGLSSLAGNLGFGLYTRRRWRGTMPRRRR